MGKYYSGADSADEPKGPRGCGGLDGAYVNDVIGEGCWAITGYPVTIGDTMDCIQSGFEICNFNFRVDATMNPVATVKSLEGPVL
jgi:hypothetical protein